MGSPDLGNVLKPDGQLKPRVPSPLVERMLLTREGIGRRVFVKVSAQNTRWLDSSGATASSRSANTLSLQVGMAGNIWCSTWKNML